MPVEPTAVQFWADYSAASLVAPEQDFVDQSLDCLESLSQLGFDSNFQFVAGGYPRLDDADHPDTPERLRELPLAAH